MSAGQGNGGCGAPLPWTKPFLKNIFQRENATQEHVKDQGIGKETEQDFMVM